ncbi:hypothetical protein, partial [Klebsiella pneumoniae]
FAGCVLFFRDQMNTFRFIGGQLNKPIILFNHMIMTMYGPLTALTFNPKPHLSGVAAHYYNL